MTKTIIAAVVLFWAMAAGAVEYSDVQIVNAIFRAENSTAHPYGIIPKYKHTTPRQACFNSVRNARIRWYSAGSPGDFITFMGLRYSPPAQNPNWVKLVYYFLRHP